MNLERLRWGDWIAAIAGLDLILVTFRGWYKVAGTDAYVTAWDALDNGRYLLIATGIVGILLLLLKAAESELSFPPGWLAAVVGFACTVYIAYRLATPPADVLDAASGIFIGLAGALGVTIGGLLSARDDAARAPSASSVGSEPTAEGTPPAAVPVGAYAAPPSNETWSPAAPAAASTGWSPAAPAAPAPPATAAGAAAEPESGLRPGDQVVLTTGGPRFPAGTVAEVVEAFAGGALVEVKAPDGVGERFEVPNSAFEPASAGGGSWSPAMPAAAGGEDWGFDEPGAAATAEAPAAEEAAPEAPAEKKVPWYKREIGGGKKKKEAEGAVAVGAAAAAGAAIAASDRDDEEAEAKPGFFKRMFGGGSKADPETAALEGEPTPATDVAGVGTAAESDTAVAEGTTPDEPIAGPEDVAGPAVIAAEPEPQAVEPDPEPVAPDPEPAASAPDPIASEPEPAASEPEAPASDPDPVAAEPDASASAPEAAASAPEAEAGEAAPAASEPEPGPDSGSGDVGSGLAAGAAGGAAGAAAAAAAGGDDEPKPKRKRSSGSRKVPDAALAAGENGDAEVAPTRKRSSGSRKVPKEVLAGVDAPPKVGDEVQLKVGGGRFDAGTRGKVVDVFSAGVIVELSDDEGRTERLDLPFEAIGPADA